MKYDEACQRLRNHANLPNAGPDSESLGHAIHQISKGDRPPNNLLELYEDVVHCLETVNLHLNGIEPSAAGNERKEPSIDRSLCHAISLILVRQFAFVQSQAACEVRESAIAMTRRLALAWHYVLAGDIDQIATEVEFETRVSES